MADCSWQSSPFQWIPLFPLFICKGEEIKRFSRGRQAGGACPEALGQVSLMSQDGEESQDAGRGSY